MKKIIVIIGSAFAVLLIAIVGVLYFQRNPSSKKDDMGVHQTYRGLPVRTYYASYSLDISSNEELIGDADYCILAEVISEDETVYEDFVGLEQEDGSIKEVGTPYTNYTVKVCQNIKGNLEEGKQIRIKKEGGLGQTGDFYEMAEGDILLETGSYYIIMAYVQDDGSLLVSGENSSKEFVYHKSTLKKDLKVYKTAYKNQKKTVRKRAVLDKKKVYK